MLTKASCRAACHVVWPSNYRTSKIKRRILLHLELGQGVAYGCKYCFNYSVFMSHTYDSSTLFSFEHSTSLNANQTTLCSTYKNISMIILLDISSYIFRFQSLPQLTKYKWKYSLNNMLKANS